MIKSHDHDLAEVEVWVLSPTKKNTTATNKSRAEEVKDLSKGSTLTVTDWTK